MAETLIAIIRLAAQIITLLIIARAVISFFPVDRSQPVVRFIYNLTEPILEPVRRILPQTGMIDFSPLVVILLIDLLAVPVLTALVRSLF